MMWLVIHKKGPFVTAVNMIGVVVSLIALIPPNGEMGPFGVTMSSCGITGWYCFTKFCDLGDSGEAGVSTVRKYSVNWW